jgi:DNA-directed RNA polymerase alpha subunit
MKNQKNLYNMKNLIDLECSIRLLNITKRMGITTIDELKEWYNTHTELPPNMGKKSLMEVEELISAGENGMTRYQHLDKLKEEKKINRMKDLVKNLHKEVFYMEGLNLDKLYKLNLELNKTLKTL